MPVARPGGATATSAFLRDRAEEHFRLRGALPFRPEDAELAALAVNPFYRDGGRGERLLEFAEARAREMGLKSLFVLSTRTTHWFIERGFAESDPERLPEKKQALYNYDRRSKVFVKEL